MTETEREQFERAVYIAIAKDLHQISLILVSISEKLKQLDEKPKS